MPVTKLLDPKTRAEVPLEGAEEYFEERGILPAEVITLIKGDVKRGPEGRVFTSPSLCDPGTTCRRQILIERFLGYTLDPLRIWMAKEGVVWHQTLENMGGAGWEHETWLPNALIEPDPMTGGERTTNLPPGVKVCPDGKLRLEVWPGVWMRGRVDRHRTDWSEIGDFKTQRASKRDYGMKKDWVLRLNIYTKMVKLLKPELPDPKLWVWRVYRGAYEMNRVFRKFPIPIMPEQQLNRVGEFAASMQSYLEQAQAADDVEDVIRGMPMDGERMFNGKKCPEYCSVLDECYRIAGKPTF